VKRCAASHGVNYALRSESLSGRERSRARGPSISRSRRDRPDLPTMGTRLDLRGEGVEGRWRSSGSRYARFRTSPASGRGASRCCSEEDRRR